MNNAYKVFHISELAILLKNMRDNQNILEYGKIMSNWKFV